MDLVSAWNPWWAEPGRRTLLPQRTRSIFEELCRRLTEPDLLRAQVLLGPRQVGKTTLLNQIANHFLDAGWPPANVAYFDLSDDRFDHTHSLREILEVLPPGLRKDHPRLLLIDELTRAPRWDLTLKQWVDDSRTRPASTRNRILATDSAAALMRKGASDSLQGRIDQMRIHGLTFREALRIQGLEHEDERDTFLRLPGALERFLAWGGLPEHLTTERSQDAWERIRRDVTEGAIARDLAREHSVDVERVAALFRYIVQESGSLFEAKHQADILQTDPRTIRRWVGLLEQACLVEGLESWNPGLRKSSHYATHALKTRRKLYAEDHGFIPAYSPFVSPMTQSQVRGRVFETVVFTHLRALRGEQAEFELFYFREKDKAEIDFVMAFEDAVLGLEVTSSKSPGKKHAALERASKRAGLDRVILVHGAPLAPKETEAGATWPLDAFLLDPRASIDAALEWTRKSR